MKTSGGRVDAGSVVESKLETWALFAEIAGAPGMVVSVIYLRLQISDDTKLLRSQAHYNALSLAQRPLEMMVYNESLAGVVTQCDANPDACFKSLVRTKPGYVRLWKETAAAFDEPFRSYAVQEFERLPAPATGER